MRVLLTGGGTAGHINPALAIADTIRQNDPDAEIAYVGTPKGMENELVAREGYRMYHVDVRGISRSLSPKNIKAFWLAVTSPKRAEKIIDDFRPDIVVGTGGYACWPVLVAAARKGVPSAVHEANAVPGMTVKRLEKHVDKVFLNFKKTSAQLKYPEKHVHVGCPLRRSFSVSDHKASAAELGLPEDRSAYVLSYGGSLGADRVNAAMLEVFSENDTRLQGAVFCHATGERNFVKFRTLFAEMGLASGPRLEILSYVYDMPVRMAAADIVVCRSGAITLSELALLGKCAILIPSPNVTDNQQVKNAKLLADAGAAVMIEEKKLTGELLCDTLADLITRPEKRDGIERAIRSFAVPDSNKRIYEEMVAMIGKGGK